MSLIGSLYLLMYSITETNISTSLPQIKKYGPDQLLQSSMYNTTQTFPRTTSCYLENQRGRGSVSYTSLRRTKSRESRTDNDFLLNLDNEVKHNNPIEILKSPRSDTSYKNDENAFDEIRTYNQLMDKPSKYQNKH
jgi:hypothetical protein